MVVARVNVHFSILDEYERRRNEGLLVGFGAGFPGKFMDVGPPQMQFKAFWNVFTYSLHAWSIYFYDLFIYLYQLFWYKFSVQYH